jgi:hypothetical protein
MGELWRWNGHRTRSGSRAPEHDLAWQLPAPTAPPGLGQADAVPRRKENPERITVLGITSQARIAPG